MSVISVKFRDISKIFLVTVGGKESLLIMSKMDIDEVERESLRRIQTGRGKGLGGLRVRGFPVLQRFVRSEPREPSL